MMRLSRYFRIFYVRPISIHHVIKHKHERHWGIKEVAADIFVKTILLPPGAHTRPHVQQANEQRVIRSCKQMMRRYQIQRPWLWFYAPISLYLKDVIEHQGLIYDCTDAWGEFEQSSLLLKERERQLSRLADVVFTGTGQLYDDKSLVNANTHCLPCGIEFDPLCKVDGLFSCRYDRPGQTHCGLLWTD